MLCRSAGMYAVGLHELRVFCNPRQQFGHQRDRFSLSDLVEQRLEALGENRPIIRRESHSDQQHPDVSVFRHAHDLAKMRPGLGKRYAAQTIITAELDNEDVRMITVQGSRQASEPAACRITGDAGVDYPIVPVLFDKACRQQCNPAGVLIYAVRRAEAVTEHQDRVLARSRRQGRQ